MTYSNMKPLDPDAHKYLADWVRRGGKLLYCGTDSDPFQQVQEWWNTGDNHYAAPADHLFEQLGLEAGVPAGIYPYGKGTVCILRQDPEAFVKQADGENALLSALESLKETFRPTNTLYLERGPYRIVAVMDEVAGEPFTMEGCFIDLYDPALPVYQQKTVLPGQQALFYDVTRAGKAPQILAAASRAYDETRGKSIFSYTCKGPAGTWNATRILLPAPPKTVLVNGEASSADWDDASKTCFLRFPNHPDGVLVEIGW
jgi:hypothetical protein